MSDRKKKILVISNICPNPEAPNKGFYVWNQVKRLRDDFDVMVLVTHPKRSVNFNQNGAVSRTEFDGIPIWERSYPVFPKLGVLFSGHSFLRNFRGTVQKIHQEFPFDLILCYWTYPDGFAAVRFAKEYGVPIIVRPRGSDINLCIDRFILRQHIKQTLAQADKVIPVSAALKNRIASIGIDEQNMSVIPNGVDLAEFYPIDRDQCRKKLGLDLNRKAVIFIGNLIEVKGIKYFLDAIQDLDRQKDFSCDFYFLGEGHLNKDIEKIKDSLTNVTIRLLGDVPHDKLLLWLNAANLLCLPSVNEGWPNVLMEAFACGVPVVATRVGGIPEIVSSENIGTLVPKESGEQLSIAIQESLSKEWDRGLILARVKNESWDKAAASLKNEILSVMRGRQ